MDELERWIKDTTTVRDEYRGGWSIELHERLVALAALRQRFWTYARNLHFASDHYGDFEACPFESCIEAREAYSAGAEK